MTPREGPKIEAGAIWAALVKRYPAPQYALLAQVGNGTGYGANRWADALAMSLWPSRGLHLHGFEIKVYRNDWLRELKNPAKAEEIAPFCDYWWIAAPAEIVKLEELPPAWGLLEMKGARGLVQVKAAVENSAARPLDTAMVAAILRRASETMVPRAAVQALEDAERDSIFERGKSLGQDHHTKDNLARLTQSVADFEKASGVRITDWNGANIGNRFKAVALLDDLAAGRRLDDLIRPLQATLDSLKATQRLLQTPSEGTAP
jgi:hypothetical protein